MFETSVIARLEAKLKREREAQAARGESKTIDIEQLRAATAQSNEQLLIANQKIIDELRELRATKDAPPPEWDFRVQRDGANNMIGVTAKQK